MAQHWQEYFILGLGGIDVAEEFSSSSGKIRDAARNLGGIRSWLGGFVSYKKFGFTL